VLLGVTENDSAACALCDWAGAGGERALRAHLAEWHHRLLVAAEDGRGGRREYRGPARTPDLELLGARR